jgi:ribose-phosphate pyrophosphokinase
VERFREANFKEVIVADTIPLPHEKQFQGLTTLPVAPLLARVVRSIHENKSVTEAL